MNTQPGRLASSLSDRRGRHEAGSTGGVGGGGSDARTVRGQKAEAFQIPSSAA